MLKSGMHTAVLKEINSTCECFSKEVILEEFEAYFGVLEREVFMIVGLQMIFGCILLFPISLIFENWNIEWSTSFILAFLYTTLVPGLLGTLIWFYLVRRVGPVRAATFHFLNPFFGVLVAALILSEPLSVRDGIGVTIIMAGILLVQMSRRQIANLD